MVELSEKVFGGWVLHPPASDAQVVSAVATFGFQPPADFIDFHRRHDGGEGFVGDRYLVLWKLGELRRFNEDYEVDDCAPGLFLFGSDGGGEGFGFDLRNDAMPIIQVPFIGMELRHARRVARTFVELLTLSPAR